MKEKRIKILAVVIVFLVLALAGAGVYWLVLNKPTSEEEGLANQLQEELNISKVKIGEDEVVIDYNQPIEFEDEAELFGTWAYILGTAFQESPEVKTIIVNCIFEDRQKVKITADRQTIQDFLDEKITALEFLQLITAEAISEGPEI